VAIETGLLKPVAKGDNERLSPPEGATEGVSATAAEITAVAKQNIIAKSNKERFIA
jgi:hypothetical protein